MALEQITFSMAGLLANDQVSQQVSVSYQRILTKVRLSTKGVTPAGSDLKVKLRLDESAEATEYTLPAGLKFAENNANVTIAADTLTDFIVTANGGAADLDVQAEFSVSVTVSGGSTTDLYLGTLGQLKRFILNAGVVAETTYDEALTVLGRGVARSFDRYCHRQFVRAVSTTEDFRAGTDALLLSRYPVESVASVASKEAGESSFTTQSGVVDTLNETSGILMLLAEVGTERGLLRVTYTGGYWVDTSDDDSGTLPTGATALPKDVQMGWLLQCQQVWQSRDALGIKFAEGEGGGGLLNTRLGILSLVPEVKQILEPYQRWEMSL